MSIRRVPIIEVGDHKNDVFTVPLEGIDEFIRDNRDEYDFGFGEMSAELGAIKTIVSASKTIQPVNTSGEALFVKSPGSKSLSPIKSVVMAPSASATLAAEQAAKKKAAEAAAKKAADEAAKKKAADEAAKKKAADEAAKKAAEAAKSKGIFAAAADAVSKATEMAKAAVLEPAKEKATVLTTAQDKINAALAASVGQKNKAPPATAITTFSTSPSTIIAPGVTLASSGKYKTPSISISGSASGSSKLTTPSIKPAVSAALTAPVTDVINKAAAVIAAEAALKEKPKPADDAVFVSPDRTTPLAIKDVMMKPTPSAVVAAAQLPASKIIQPPVTATSRVDPGPYLTMKTSVEPLTAAKAAAAKPLDIVNKVAALAPDISAIPAIQALAKAAKDTPAPAGNQIATLLETLGQVGGPEKCACIVARKKQGLAALGVQTPTLRSKVPQKTFVASPRVDFQGQVLSALHQIEMNTSNEQLRSRLEKLRNAVGG